MEMYIILNLYREKKLITFINLRKRVFVTNYAHNSARIN